MGNGLPSFGVTNVPTAVPATSQVVIPQITVQQPTPGYTGFGLQSTGIQNQPATYEQIGPQLNKVKGTDGAKQFPTVPNAVYALFDEDDEIVFFKATDKNNYPILLKRCRYYEEEEVPPTVPEYVTKQEYDALYQETKELKDEIKELKEVIASGKHLQHVTNNVNGYANTSPNGNAANAKQSDRK